MLALNVASVISLDPLRQIELSAGIGVKSVEGLFD